MAWVDTTYIDNFIGSNQRQKLYVDSAGSYDATVFAQFELSARATVVSVMQYAGYPNPGATLSSGEVSTGFLQKLVSAVMVRDAYSSRKGIRLGKEVGDAITDSLAVLDAVYQKKLPIPGMEPVAKNGYGGVQFSPTTGDNARTKAFSLRNSGF